ncbi:hypothetical protein K461DRAFT_274344 [Myriangium duriaei CBS 260.36]|uniref:25S rRNA adenine-N(1) methyltransferase n=1 Tax=Myriangium duriaei CBS 260.36 TaxID=1168546 RepID=A0A9P4JAV1_9PEZI|nr:hypothetical protein K461DRAFT_274344 [Myriangium duriaei CBS 260.36]
MTRSKKQPKSLAAGRTPIVKQHKARFSAKKGRTIIRSHHQLSKSLADAEKAGNAELALRLRRDIARNGGLETYQQASLLGQSSDRGGDSSKVLVNWLKALTKHQQQPLKVLEVGALSLTNACSCWELMEVTRIDLNSQTPGIEQQDFMQRPLPSCAEDKFDVISLSLVLNFVPSKEGRGQMLRRTCEFLHSRISPLAADNDGESFAPCLFLVLPAPCVENSRYMDEERLQQIMESLGYVRTARKLSPRLIYSLWNYVPGTAQPKTFGKVEVNPGVSRNNFCIVL